VETGVRCLRSVPHPFSRRVAEPDPGPAAAYAGSDRNAVRVPGERRRTDVDADRVALTNETDFADTDFADIDRIGVRIRHEDTERGSVRVSDCHRLAIAVAR
jgi:hypothetical protein